MQKKDISKNEILEGVIDSLIYESEDGTFKIAQFLDENKTLCTITGNLISVQKGDNIRISGYWTIHSIYGKQFKVSSYMPVTPSTKDSIYSFFASGMIEGIGESYAKRIVDYFGDKALEVLEKNPERYLEINGIGQKKLEKIVSSYNETYSLKKTLIELFKYDISSNFAMKLYNKYKEDTLDTLFTNPYIICNDIKGIGFKTADQLAIKLGVDLDLSERKKQAILYILTQGSYDGNTFMLYEDICESISKLIGLTDKEVVLDCLLQMYSNRLILLEKKDEDLRVYLYKYCMAETDSASGIIRLLTETSSNINQKDAQILVNRELSKQSLDLSSEQVQSALMALTNKVLIITGGPGTGKTTVLKFIVQIFESIGKKVKLCAPTGKASKRMSNSTDRPASTIHRLLEMGVGDEGEENFLKNEDNPINADVIIVDESSMIDIILLKNLLAAVDDKTKLIFVGDKDQLPSVGCGNVLKDMIDSGIIPKVILNKIFRQASMSNIIVNAHRINKGYIPLPNSVDNDFFIMKANSKQQVERLIVDLTTNRLPSYYNIDINDIQVITPMKKNQVGTQSLNMLLQKTLNPSLQDKKEFTIKNKIYREGDRVIHIKNNYELEWTLGDEKGKGVFNGETGNILVVDNIQKTIIVQFDDGKKVFYDFMNIEELEHSYALTVHKSQGSEYPCVIFPIYKVSPLLLTRKILYTGITRAKKLLIIISSQDTIKKMVDNVYLEKRNSSLMEKLTSFLNTDLIDEVKDGDIIP